MLIYVIVGLIATLVTSVLATYLITQKGAHPVVTLLAFVVLNFMAAHYTYKAIFN